MTVLVSSLKQLAAATLSVILALHKEYLTYATSFFVLCILWHNLHNTFQVVHKINSGILWANSLLLFVISFSHTWRPSLAIIFRTGCRGIVFLLISLMYVLLCFILHWAGKSNKDLFQVIYRPPNLRFIFCFKLFVLSADTFIHRQSSLRWPLQRPFG